MLDFENKIISLLKKNNISFRSDQSDHTLSVDSFRIIFRSVKYSSNLDYSNDKDSERKLAIHIWEDQYYLKPEVVASRLLSKLGVSSRIYARETTINSVSQHQLNEFLNKNHLNVAIKAKYSYGLYYKNKLVATAAFGRSCPVQYGVITYKSHELIRYCSLLNQTVVGGLSKLIKHFEVSVKPEHLMTYVDREWSEGQSYLKIGFQVDKITAQQRFWLSPLDNKRYYEHEVSMEKNLQVLQKEGWRLIQNLGNIKLVKFLI